MDLENPEYRMRVAQALANAGLYKAGDSLDHKKQINNGVLAIIASIIIGLFTITQANAISSLIVLAFGVGFGYVKYSKGKKMEEVLRANKLIGPEEKEKKRDT